MDNEELEQIPWSSLVSDKAEGVDKRLYIAVGIVGVIVALIFGSRLLGGSQTQPAPALEAAPQSQPTIALTPTTVGMIVSEADLMAAPPMNLTASEPLHLVAFAEWFVTDFYTTDGSSENVDSVRTLMSPSAASIALPHIADPAPATTYVEWARALGSRSTGEDLVEVDVVFRTISETADGYVRNPMSAAIVTMRVGAHDSGVVGAPVPIPLPTFTAVVNDASGVPDQSESAGS